MRCAAASVSFQDGPTSWATASSGNEQRSLDIGRVVVPGPNSLGLRGALAEVTSYGMRLALHVAPLAVALAACGDREPLVCEELTTGFVCDGASSESTSNGPPGSTGGSAGATTSSGAEETSGSGAPAEDTSGGSTFGGDTIAADTSGGGTSTDTGSETNATTSGDPQECTDEEYSHYTACYSLHAGPCLVGCDVDDLCAFSACSRQCVLDAWAECDPEYPQCVHVVYSEDEYACRRDCEAQSVACYEAVPCDLATCSSDFTACYDAC